MGKSTTKSSMKLTLRAIAYLLRYPDAEMRLHLAQVRDALDTETALSSARQAEIVALIERLLSAPDMTVEAEYIEMFDRGHRTSLLLFEHVHGDSRDRGPAMVDLIQTYEKAGLYLHPEQMPDDLPVVLEYASSQPASEARAFMSEIAHIVRVIYSALVDRGSAYACLAAAVLELAGEKVTVVAIEQEPELDEQWTEPEVFGGCSSAGQAKPGAQPGQSQPIKIMPRATNAASKSQSTHQGVRA